MSKVTVQVTTMAGKFIDDAKWVVEFPSGLQEGHLISLSMPITDPSLASYVGKLQNVDCVIDKEDDEYSVTMTCQVRKIRHMINTKTKLVESLAIIIPSNRLAEGTITYTLAPSKCDSRFVQAVRGSGAPIQP